MAYKVVIPKDSFKIFQTELLILSTHTSDGCHLKSDSLISLLNEARINFLKKHNLNEKELIKDVNLLISHLAVDYISEGKYSDKLIVEIYFPLFMNKTYCTLYYKVINTHTKSIIAIAETKITFFDINKKKVTKIPEPFKLIKHNL